MITDQEILEGLLRKRALLKRELDKLNLAIDLFGGNDSTIDQSANDMMTGAIEYDSFASMKDKIIFALNKLNNASAQDISQYLALLGEDNDIDDSLFQSVTLNASRLYRSGVLLAKKEGKRYIYSIPDPDAHLY